MSLGKENSTARERERERERETERERQKERDGERERERERERDPSASKETSVPDTTQECWWSQGESQKASQCRRHPSDDFGF